MPSHQDRVRQNNCNHRFYYFIDQIDTQPVTYWRRCLSCGKLEECQNHIHSLDESYCQIYSRNIIGRCACGFVCVLHYPRYLGIINSIEVPEGY